MGDRELSLSNLDKLIWPGDGVTKADLIRYFVEMADLIIPHVSGRPLSVTRYPDGIEGDWFYQKQAPGHTPKWVSTYRHVSSDGDPTDFILAEEPAALGWLGNEAVVELHPWLSKLPHPERPDVMVFDLDPDPPSGFEESRMVALRVKEILDHLGLRAYAKISGATGIHLYVPLLPELDHDRVVDFAEAVARLAHDEMKEETTLERSTKKREGKVYLDYLQNARGKTMVAPYSPRPRPGAPVSMPLTWEEVASPLDPSAFNIRTAPGIARSKGDPWSSFLDPESRQRLPSVPR